MRSTIVLFFLLAWGCDLNPSRKEALNPDKLLPNAPSGAFTYVREDLTCAPGNALAEFADPSIRVFENTDVTSTKATLHGSSGTPYLAGPHINLTAYDFESRTDCSPQGNCQERIVKGALALPICRADGFYDRESIEGVGVTSYAHLDRVFQFHADAAGKTLEPVRLFILPRIVRVDQNSNESIMSDNAAYVGGEKAVLVYPKGRIGAKIWPGVNLWESSFVLAHEGSHHIFQEYFFKTIHVGSLDPNVLREKNAPVLKLDEDDYFPPPVRREAAETHGVDANDIVGAVNEGFADLYAFYAVKENSAAIGEMTCFAKGRDILSPVFRSGEKKVLSTVGLNTFFSPVVIDPYVPSQTYACDVLDYQDIHHVGTIIVHGLNRLFAASARVKNAADKTKEKALMATEWVSQMAQRTIAEANVNPQLPDPPTFLRILIEEGVKRATADGRTLTAEQCMTLRDVFPVYEAEWKQLGVFRCP